MTLLAFLLALGVLITVHEWGHYRVAVACGVKVLTFSIGFGKPLIRWKSRYPHPGQDTEFCICLIPLGGYVKMLDKDQDSSPLNEAHRALNRQSLWKRILIVSAGPLANLLLAIFLYAATFWLGQYELKATLSGPLAGSVADVAGLRSGDTVLRSGTSVEELQEVKSIEDLRGWLVQQNSSSVFFEVQPKDEQTKYVLHLAQLPADSVTKENNAWQARGLTSAWSPAVLGEVKPGLAADKAGLQRGDEVLRINGHLINDAFQLRALVRASGQSQIPLPQIWDISRGGHRFELEVKPEQAEEGHLFIGRIGAQVGEPAEKVWVQYSFLEGIDKSLVQTWEVIVMTLDMVGRLITGQASLDNLSGPLAMADYAGRSASLGLSMYLSFLALVSINLGVFNLLPLPVLDGGHLLYYLYEACTGHPPSTAWLDVMQRVGLMILVALMVFSLFNDVVRLGWLP